MSGNAPSREPPAALPHEQAAALLPWLVNGTLVGEELERVETHVRGCLRCRTELAEQNALRAVLRRQPPAALSADAHFESLRGRLELEPRRAERRFSSRAGYYATAAVLVLAGVGVLLGLVQLGDVAVSNPSAAYRSLSSDAPGDTLVDVIFADGVREAQMRALLADLGAEIVAGPSATLGRYTLRITGTAPHDVHAVVAGLMRDERVRFAAPAYSPQTPAEPPIAPPSEER